MVNRKLVSDYLRQQYQLSMPDFIFDNNGSASVLKAFYQVSLKNSAQSCQEKKQYRRGLPKPQKPESITVQKEKQVSISSRLSALKPIDKLLPGISGKNLSSKPQVHLSTDLNYEQKRLALKELYIAGCDKCHLAQTRNKFIFGAGNADARIMIIGEAPGRDEDIQGLPFVGKAGQLLTSMLEAIKLDRNKDVFITNVLKCRPPGNRNPEAQEIITCFPLLERQIAIIQPKAILLLGRIAAHSVLGINDSIAMMRSKVHDFKGIPVMVIYHPAALLRNASLKRPAWEDLQKFQTLLNDSGIYGYSK
ncbi:MAG TPA: uracil-DNA glycosylase [Chitinispirillaceae bacterium]|nr:uracil-DNA glycosylase [Chitinispirillaceae bacterium]